MQKAEENQDVEEPVQAGRERTLMRALALGGSLLLTLVVCELAVRLLCSEDAIRKIRHGTFTFHVTRGMELVPGSHDELVSVNSRGYRDREYPLQKPPGTRRIIAIGDSIVFGAGVRIEDTFCKRLEARLNSGPGHPVEVINGGVPDTGLAEMVHEFQKRDLPMKPDVALACIYLNDSRPPAGFRAESVGGDPIVRFVQNHSWVRESWLISFLYRSYFDRVVHLQFAKGPPVSRRQRWVKLYQRGTWQQDPEGLEQLIQQANMDWGAAWQESGWPSVSLGLEELNRICHSNKIRVAMVLMPVTVQIYGAKECREPQDRLLQFAKALGWPCLDLLPEFQADKRRHAGNQRLETETYFLDHCHLTPSGHKRVGELLEKFFREHRLLEE